LNVLPSVGEPGAGSFPVVNVTSGPNVVPAEFVATSRTWYSAFGTRPETDADTIWLAKSEPTDCAGVEFVYTTGPPPKYFGSSPYWNIAVVGRPFGFADPKNAAFVLPTEGAPVTTAVGTDCAANVAVTAVSAVIVT
jgi:hypothetical protein